MPLPTASLLVHGHHSCPKWGVLALELAFFNGVFRSLVATPLFSMLAVCLFVRNLLVSYAALYCLAGMIVALLGCMRLFGIPLGVAEALTLSLVVGMAVDYLIHIAHAYRHSLATDRFFKSRAAFLARAYSIFSAAITTLAAVVPLLFARLLPLRDFGYVFAIVTIVSLAFAVAFMAILMAVGPLTTAGGLKATGRGARPVNPSGAGWSLHVDLGEAHGAHDVCGAPRHGGGNGDEDDEPEML